MMMPLTVMSLVMVAMQMLMLMIEDPNIDSSVVITVIKAK